MLYAVLKAVHLLSIVLWVGGMFFTLACLRPALGLLDPPARLRLMNEVMRRFLAAVNIAIGFVLLTGLWMLWLTHQAAGGAAFHVPPAWYVMVVLGLVMMAIFGQIRSKLWRRLQVAVQAQDWPAAAAMLDKIRRGVMLNLVLGVVVIAAMKVGTAI